MKTPHLVDIDDLPDLILDYLRKSSRVITELATLTGYANSTVRVRLERMEHEGLVHRISEGSVLRGRGGYNLWHFGPAPANVFAKPANADTSSGVSQRTVSTYQIHSRRDELQEAFFGPAGSKP
jgi:DNA-binding HxlR family transcriptional regulator